MYTRRIKKPAGWLKTCGLLLTLIFSLAGPAIRMARAASYAVNLKEVTLREAILSANAAPGEDTITFTASGTILLTRPLPTITDPAGLIIDGAGQNLTISGNHAVYVLEVVRGAALTVRNLTIADGTRGAGGGGIWNNGTLTVYHSTFSGNHGGFGGGIVSFGGTVTVTDSTFYANFADRGGGIFNNGTLTVYHSTFSENQATFGGGLYSAGFLIMSHSTFSGNSVSGGGGGIAVGFGPAAVSGSAFIANSANLGGGISSESGPLSVTDSTFSENSAFSAGGGISNYSTFYQSGGMLEITNSTFSGNSAHSGGGLFNYGALTVTNATFTGNEGGGAGIFNGSAYQAVVTLRNTIVANSVAVNCLNNGSLIDGGGNLSWPDASCPGLNADPLLGPLQDNGGPTQTHALLAGSPAIDVALLANCPATDQRGVSRPQGPGCDIGAFELGLESIAPIVSINTPVDEAVYTLGQAVIADYACQDEDGGSGLAFCLGTVPSGSPIDTASLGDKTFSVEAADNAGNFSSLTYHYSVVYDFSGFFQPVDDLPTLNVVQAGLGVPVRFSLGGDQGLSIFAAGYPASVEIPCTGGAPEDAIEEFIKVRSSSLSYDALSDIYTYIWKTNTAWVDTCRQLNFLLKDGSEHTVNFKFVK